MRDRSECGPPAVDEPREERPDWRPDDRREFDPDGRCHPRSLERRPGVRDRIGVVARAGFLAASGPGDVNIEGTWHSVPQIGALIGEDVEIANGVNAAAGTVVNERARVESGARLRGTILRERWSCRCAGSSGMRVRRDALPNPARRPEATRIPRVRQCRRRDRGSALQVMKDKGFIANLRRSSATAGIDGSRAYADGRPMGRRQSERASARRLHREDRTGPQRNHRELCEPPGKAAGPRSQVRESNGHGELVHLIESYYEGDLETATRKALGDIRGPTPSLRSTPTNRARSSGAERESLVVGLGPDENFLASDVPALLRYTDRVAYVMDRRWSSSRRKGRQSRTPRATLCKENRSESRGPSRTRERRLRALHVEGDPRGAAGDPRDPPRPSREPRGGRLPVEGITSVKLVACGTSYHAALVGKYVIEEIARIPASAELGRSTATAKARRSDPCGPDFASGETADTSARRGSASPRLQDPRDLQCHRLKPLPRGPRRSTRARASRSGVAATKTFIAHTRRPLPDRTESWSKTAERSGYDELEPAEDQLSRCRGRSIMSSTRRTRSSTRREIRTNTEGHVTSVGMRNIRSHGRGTEDQGNSRTSTRGYAGGES